MRQPLSSAGLLFLLAATATAQQPVNPLFAPPTGDPFGSSFYTAPNTNTLPNGGEVPPPAPEALLGPGDALCRERVWLSADFLYAAASRTLLPPLVTGSPAGTDPAVAGVLGRPTTAVAFGGNQLSEMRPSMRADGGVWFGERFGIDGTFLTLFETTERFVGSATPGGTILARPVVSGVAGGEAAVLVGQNGRPGTVWASAGTFTIGGDVNLRYNVGKRQFSRWDVFAGYRYLHLRDSVQVTTEQQTFLPVPVPGDPLALVMPTGTSTASDLFRTRNEFHGPQVGVASSHRLFDRVTLSTKLGVAMGVTRSDTDIRGSTTGPVSGAFGLLANEGNAGRYTRNAFAVIPSADVRLGYDITDWLRFSVGYTFLYWSSVERAADQIDRGILAPGRPAYPAYSTDYWVQGVTLGVGVRY